MLNRTNDVFKSKTKYNDLINNRIIFIKKIKKLFYQVKTQYFL